MLLPTRRRIKTWTITSILDSLSVPGEEGGGFQGKIRMQLLEWGGTMNAGQAEAANVHYTPSTTFFFPVIS